MPGCRQRAWGDCLGRFPPAVYTGNRVGGFVDYTAHRRVGYALLNGLGLEVGAGNAPAQLPSSCIVQYCDAIVPAQARDLFPELTDVALRRIPEPDWVVDVADRGLDFCVDRSLDFVIANHLLEQVIDPITLLREFDRVLKPGGRMVLSVSDKHFSEERLRPLIDFSTLAEIHLRGGRQVVPEDYMDIVRYVHPELIGLPSAALHHHLVRFMERREHLHVWTSDLFREFLERSMQLLKLGYSTILEVTGDQSSIEYFVVLGKNSDGHRP